MKSSATSGIALTMVIAMTLPGLASGAEKYPNAIESDPAKLGWMVGSPPPPDRIVRFDDGSYFKFPALRWSVEHFRQLMPTVNVSRGLGAPVDLKSSLIEQIDNVSFLPLGSNRPMSWRESLLANYTDGIAILHRGKLVYERYFGVLTPGGVHADMSVTKSFVGTLAAMMVAEGTLDPERKVVEYVPELRSSAFGNATVRQVMDMTTALKYSEDYADPNADVWKFAEAGNPLPKPKDYRGPRTYYEYLETVKPDGVNGVAFHYATPNAQALGWILARVSGRTVAQLLSERIWSKLAAEQDANMTVDSIGTPYAGGGLSTGLRDLARFGEMIRNEGRYNGQQIIPRAAVADIRKGGSREAFAKAGYTLLKGWSYRDMWWITNNEHGAFTARGVHGQAIYIDPVAEMVIARYASHPVSANSANDPTSLPAYAAVADFLMKNNPVKKPR